MRVINLLVSVTLLGVTVPAQAGGPRVNPYDGLVPKGFSVKPAARTCQVLDLAAGKVSIIPSKRFLGYINTFAKRKLRGGWSGASASSNNFYMTSADPQLITDFLVELLGRNGIPATISSDIPSSIASGATYFLILDFKSNYHAFGGGQFGTRDVEGGVYILDRSLSACHSSLANASAPVGEGTDLQGHSDGVLVYSMGIVQAHKAFQTGIATALNRDLFGSK